ncbi:sigma 54-interacting transcriptional regulator [Clostridium sediminicola]|uniref:sigma-54 interaction domain-containing protein n=1 Tax=Clostridium sediminicola TaxID=3114879 RepID=UPI0031F24D1F
MYEFNYENSIDKFFKSIPSSLFNKLPLPINFVDANCRVIVMNQAFLNYLDIPLSDVVGKHLSEIDHTTRLPTILKTGISEIGHNHKFANGKESIVDRIAIFDGDKVIGGAGIIVLDNIETLSSSNNIRNSIISSINPINNSNKIKTNSSFSAKYSFDDIITHSSLIKNLKTRAQAFAQTDLPVLIIGESGVGKELFAHSIHNYSKRMTKPFVSINCAAIPETLLESELFGYEGGSFTGANKSGKVGKFELAQGGTIFLDEIGDLPINMQSKLLRTLQENQIQKIGSNKSINVDVRIIAATNHDLVKKVDEKKFRADLYYRLNVLNLNIPSLRERPEDIPLLLENFRTLFYQEYEIHKEFSNEVISILTNYNWPGNVRELKNIVYRLMVIASGDKVLKSSIPNNILESNLKNIASSYNSSDLLSKNGSLNNILKEIELKIIKDTLEMCNYNKSKAAEMLSIKRMTLYRKLKNCESES